MQHTYASKHQLQACNPHFNVQIGCIPKTSLPFASSLTLVVGACFYATVVGNMALLVSNLNVTAAKHKQRLDVLNDALRYMGLPNSIMERVLEYFDYLSTYSHPGPEVTFLLRDILPRPLYNDVVRHLYHERISNVPLFSGVEQEFLGALVATLRLGVYMKGEAVFRSGEIGHEMYIVSKGKLAVLNEYDEIVGLLVEGSYFGEVALLATVRRSATVTALHYTDLLELSASDLQLVMRDFPDSAAKIKEQALKRLQDAGLISEKAHQEKASQSIRP